MTWSDEHASGTRRPEPARSGRIVLLLPVIAVIAVIAAVGAATSDGLELSGDPVLDADSDSTTDVLKAGGERASTAPSDVTTPPGRAPALFERVPEPPAAVTSVGTASPSTTVEPAAATTVARTAPPTAPPQPDDAPSVVARPVPAATPEEAPPAAPAPPWAGWVSRTAGGHVSTLVGCVPSRSARPGAAELDALFAGRVGPILGWDYQHVYPLGGDRFLWLFQDAFIDHSGGAVSLGQSSFAHNVAVLQERGCFWLLHGGSTTRPAPFEPGTGSRTLSTWFWPMGGEVHDGVLQVFWVRMVKDGYDPSPPDGLGWHPTETWVASYDPSTLARLDFRRAADPGVRPIYGYAMASDESHTYLFGNTFEQNLAREGGYWSGRHSATRIYLARVPRGRLSAAPEYRTSTGWTRDATAARPILDRHWAEFPFQPRYLDGQWVGVAAVNGYWGDEYSVDVARAPWGPWTTVESRPLAPRAGDPLMNTYHAHLAPWRDATGRLVVTLSNNARDMRRDAWPHPHRYRPMAFTSGWVNAPPPPVVTRPPTTAAGSATPAPTSSAAPTTTAPATTPPAPTTSRAPSQSSSTTAPPASTAAPTSTFPVGGSTTVAPSSSTVAAGGSSTDRAADSGP